MHNRVPRQRFATALPDLAWCGKPHGRDYTRADRGLGAGWMRRAGDKSWRRPIGLVAVVNSQPVGHSLWGRIDLLFVSDRARQGIGGNLLGASAFSIQRKS